MKIIPIFFYHEKWAVIMRKFVYSPDGGREDGSPSWGRKLVICRCTSNISSVEKMGPLRGDGSSRTFHHGKSFICREDGSPSWGRKLLPLKLLECYLSVEKMGPLRGDGSHLQLHICHIQY